MRFHDKRFTETLQVRDVVMRIFAGIASYRESQGGRHDCKEYCVGFFSFANSQYIVR